MGFYEALLEPDVADPNVNSTDAAERSQERETLWDRLQTGTPVSLEEFDRLPVRWQCADSWKVPGRNPPR